MGDRMPAFIAWLVRQLSGRKEKKETTAKVTQKRRTIEWLLAQDFAGRDFQNEERPGTDYDNVAVLRHEMRDGQLVALIPSICRGPLVSIKQWGTLVEIHTEWLAQSNDGGKTWRLFSSREEPYFAANMQAEALTIDERSDGIVVLAWDYCLNGKPSSAASIRLPGHNIHKPVA